MITLGIDTSLSGVSFALIKDSLLLAEFDAFIGRNLADKIAEIAVNLFEAAKISVNDIDRCGISAGPGSFTGLRIGIAFAKGLFADSPLEIAALSSLEIAAKSCAKTGEITVLFDARQEDVFFAKFEKSESGEMYRICEDERLPFDSALEKCGKSAGIVYSLSGNSKSPLKEILPNFECFEAEMLSGRGAAAAKIAEKTTCLTTIDEVFPNYMQLSYAERCRR